MVYPEVENLISYGQQKKLSAYSSRRSTLILGFILGEEKNEATREITETSYICRKQFLSARGEEK